MSYTKYLALSLIELLSSAPVSARRGESAEEKKASRERQASHTSFYSADLRHIIENGSNGFYVHTFVASRSFSSDEPRAMSNNNVANGQNTRAAARNESRLVPRIIHHFVELTPHPVTGDVLTVETSTVVTSNEGNIVVELPGVSDPEEAKTMIGHEIIPPRVITARSEDWIRAQEIIELLDKPAVQMPKIEDVD